MAPLNLVKAMGHAMVHIRVGEEEQDFCVHKNLICHYSPYFKTAFNIGLEEDKRGIMKLPETEVEVFELFQGRLYTQSLWDQSADGEDWLKTNDLMKLYIFADMARIPALKNQCLNTVNGIADIEEVFPVESIPYVYKNTLAGSPIRRFIVNSLTWEQCPDTFSQIADELTAEVRLEAMVAMRKVIYSYSRGGRPKKMTSPLGNMNNYYEDETKIEIRAAAKDTEKAVPIKTPSILPPAETPTSSPLKLPISPPFEPLTPPVQAINQAPVVGPYEASVKEDITDIKTEVKAQAKTEVKEDVNAKAESESAK